MEFTLQLAHSRQRTSLHPLWFSHFSINLNDRVSILQAYLPAHTGKTVDILDKQSITPLTSAKGEHYSFRADLEAWLSHQWYSQKWGLTVTDWTLSPTSSGVEMMLTLTTCSVRTDSEWMRLSRVRSSTFWDSAWKREEKKSKLRNVICLVLTR